MRHQLLTENASHASSAVNSEIYLFEAICRNTQHHRLDKAGSGDLQVLAKKVIAVFDTDVVEKARASRRSLSEAEKAYLERRPTTKKE
jgi:hypothetical protein